MLAVIKSLTRTQKRAIMLGIDAVLIPLALACTFLLQAPAGQLWTVAAIYLPILPYVIALSLIASLSLGVCSVQLNSYEGGAVGLTALYAILVGGISALLARLAYLPLPISTHVIFGISLFVLSVVSRAVLLQVVLAIYRSGTDRIRVLIYGAGTTGTQLVSALRAHEQIDPVAFVDDSKALQGLTVSRLPVHSPAHIADIVAKRDIDRVLLAMPSLGQPKQSQIARRLEKMGLEVQALPSFAQLIGQEALIDKLTPVHPSRFLNRDEVANTMRDGTGYAGRSVLITGAGGSIGAELCRQIIEARPARLVLFEMSELALYQIHLEIAPMAEESGIDLVPVLGSVTDARQVRKVLTDHAIEVVLHAAAYKHVPLVEKNPLTGLENNVLGTHTLASEAAEAGVERFILISSDKAVRPTNVMGASKRLAELVVQDLASRVPTGTEPIYSIVRFGNVLGSSGSVVPLFQDQLRRGGPLTVTHPQVARYFMTVQEAVTLVLQAGAMAQGGEVYVLDMGRPVPIDQLARQIVESAGYTVRDDTNPDGDIEIEYTGLRPGEKMREELTLSDNLVGTGHKKIFYAREDKLSEIEIAVALRALRQAVAASDEEAGREVALRWVEGFAREDARPTEAVQTPGRPVT